ncbi:MAG: glycosyltransferase family 8 protein [Planctomycetaceae bacterium]|nr:glycosyltransferase family 8 protein [Planctomycetaceae bacterium]
MSPSELHIAIASDLNYLVHAATLMRSIIDNNRQHSLVFHLLTMDKRVSEDHRLKQFFHETAGERVSYEIHHVDEKHPLIQSIPEGGTIKNRSTFLRFLASSIIDVEKLLYLDCDMIVLGDLEPFFSQELGDYIFAVVPDLFCCARALAKGFGLQYFNAGMLLFNVSVWRANNCLEKALAFTRGRFTELFAGKKHSGDQDILNIVFQGNVQYVHPKYNAVNPLFLRRCDFRGKIFVEAHDQPVIVHFAGGAKPWNVWDVHPLADKYRQYRQATPWKDIPYPIATFSKKATYPLKWFKYRFQRIICPIMDLLRRISGYPSRIVVGSRVQYLIDLTR